MSAGREMENRSERRGTSSFLLLRQGQLVSILGDVIYAIAPGFWILAATGSTILMGSLMAASMLPRILLSSVAGVVVDRFDRRRLMIWMDVIRGVAAVSVGIAAFAGLLHVWMVFAAGIIIGLCGAIFFPAVSSVIPDITEKSKVVQANSVFSMLQSGGNIVGNSAGGVLFKVLGAPFLFLFNGLSYLFSAGSPLFAKAPRVPPAQERTHFAADLRNGLSFFWKIRGPVKYGIAMAFFTGGMFLGMAFTAIVKIPPARRFVLFQVCGISSFACLAVFPFVGIFPLSIALLAASGGR